MSKQEQTEDKETNHTGLSWKNKLGAAYAGQLSAKELEQMRRDAISILRAHAELHFTGSDKATILFGCGILAGDLETAWNQILEIDQFTD